MARSSLGSVIDSDDLLVAAEALPALPLSLTRLVTLIADEDVNVRDIVETITLDQALTAAVLRQANSAASGSKFPIGTIKDAVVRLGTSTVLNIALSGRLSKQMGTAVPEYGLAAGELWRHSVSAAIAADLVRAKSPMRLPPETSTAALLHDLGKLALCQYLTPDILRVISMAMTDGGLTECEAEIEILEVHHGEVGALIAQHWKLPESIVHGVMHHHTPWECDEPLCYAVALADLLAHHLTSGSDASFVDETLADSQQEQRLTSSLERLRLSHDTCNALSQATAARFEDVGARYLLG